MFSVQLSLMSYDLDFQVVSPYCLQSSQSTDAVSQLLHHSGKLCWVSGGR